MNNDALNTSPHNPGARAQRREVFAFGILLLLFGAYVAGGIAYSSMKWDYAPLHTAGISAVSLAILGLGIWAWTGLRRGRYRIGALCFIAYNLLGVLMSLVFAFTRPPDALTGSILIVYDTAYLIWIIVCLVLVGMPLFTDPPRSGSETDAIPIDRAEGD